MSEAAAETKYCSNCKKDIAAANFTMHEVHCRRHLVLCEHCKEPVPRTEMEQHFTDVHAKVPCAQCDLELEKDQLDDHLESACPKRQVSCEYCELQLPHCNLGPHLEFCGTRTEACPRCGSFIMHKDLLRHNTSNCAYPEAKPAPPPPSTNRPNGTRFGGHAGRFGFGHRGGLFDYGGQFDDSFDPFEFEEIRRALEEDGEGRGMESLPVEDSDASAAAEPTLVETRGRGGGGRGRRADAGFGRPSVAGRVVGQKKNDVRGGGGARKAATNRRSDVNRQRQQDSPPHAIPPDVDYDTMLAMQLAAEEDGGEEGGGGAGEDVIDPDSHLNQLISSYESGTLHHHQRNRPSPMEVEEVSASTPPSALNEFVGADEDMIPCEFCGETFPAFALVHHQSVCDPLASGLWGPPREDNPLAGGFEQNNDLLNQWRPMASRPPAIPVINNLASASPASGVGDDEERGHHLSDNGDHLLSMSRLDSLEMTMLPCEFCYELLPACNLVQHQAMCEGKPATPRVTTPAAAQPSSGFGSRNQRYNFFPTTTPATTTTTTTSSTNTGPRQQRTDPTEELLASINQGGRENNGGGGIVSGAGNARPKKRPNVPRGNSNGSNANSSWGRPPLQHRRGSPREDVNENDVSMHSRRGSRQGQLGRQDSASRTRHTLNSLLSAEGEEERPAAAARPVGGASREGSTQNRRGQGARRKPPNNGTNGSGSSSFSTGVSSRTVQRQLQPTTPQDRRQRPRGDSLTEGEATPGGRRGQRERGDHVFNSAANARPPPANTNRRTAERLPEWE